MNPAFSFITKNLFPRGEEVTIFRALFSFSPELLRGWTWHLVTPNAFGAGCRGVIGPVPQPLAMSTVISTDTDRLIYEAIRVKGHFCTVFFTRLGWTKNLSLKIFESL